MGLCIGAACQCSIYASTFYTQLFVLFNIFNSHKINLNQRWTAKKRCVYKLQSVLVPALRGVERNCVLRGHISSSYFQYKNEVARYWRGRAGGGESAVMIKQPRQPAHSPARCCIFRIFFCVTNLNWGDGDYLCIALCGAQTSAQYLPRCGIKSDDLMPWVGVKDTMTTAMRLYPP